MNTSAFTEVKKETPCVVCGKPDWCGRVNGSGVCRCMRFNRDNLTTPIGWKSIKENSDGGTVFALETNGKPKAKRKIVAEYGYRDEDRKLLYHAIRFDPKGFAQRQANGTWSMGGVRKVLYRLPELIAADKDDFVFIVEGEKDVDRLRSMGFVATCNVGGAGKWKPEYSEFLRGRRVCILPDNDDAGRQHATLVARSLNGIAGIIKVVELPDLPEKGDVSDWIDMQRAECDVADLLVEFADKTAEWTEADLIGEANDHGQRPPLATWQPFPTDVLPEPLRSFVKQAAAAIGGDPSYIALPMLSAIASAIGNTREIQLKKSWREPSIVWTAIVGDSGTMKSPAIELALRAVRDRQRASMKKYREEMKEFEVAAERYSQDLTEWKKRKSTMDPPIKPEAPVADRCWCSDTTVEALATILEHQPRGVLMVRDELSGWLGSFDRYSGGKGADVAQWLEVFGGRSIIIDRKTGNSKTIYIDRAAVSVCGGIQPGPLRRAMNTENRENGLLARLLFCQPPKRAKTWTEEDIHESDLGMIEVVFDRLFDLQPDVDCDGEEFPHTITLTGEAKSAFVEFHNRHGVEQADMEGDLAAAWSKLEGYAARFAMLVHCVRAVIGDPTIVGYDIADEVSVVAGITLVRWFGNEVRRLYSTFGESDDQRFDRKLVEKIQSRGGRITARELSRSGRAYRGTGVAQGKLDSLVRDGFGTWEYSKPDKLGRKPSRIFALRKGGDSGDGANTLTHDSVTGGIGTVTTVTTTENDNLDVGGDV